jgi:hypothetical protein
MKKKSPEIDRICKYCELASSLNDPDRMLCCKKGIVSAGYSCRAFQYDPLKRVPPRPAKLAGAGLTDADFSL